MLKKLLFLPCLLGILTASLEGFYSHPGIVSITDAENGSDHLYNVPPYIGVFVEFDIDERIRSTFPVTEEQLKSKVVALFKDVGITAETRPGPGEPQLPYFHVLIMIDKIDKGYAIFCSGRLLESVTLKRVLLSKDTAIQAITWEKESLSIYSEKEVGLLLPKTVDDIVSNFTKRYKYFQSIRR